MENNQYTGDSGDRGMFYGIYTLGRQKPFITYQLQMLKNNTVETFKLWKQLYELETAYNNDKEIHDKPFGSAMRTLIQKLHHKLMEYKDPKEEGVALYHY